MTRFSFEAEDLHLAKGAFAPENLDRHSLRE